MYKLFLTLRYLRKRRIAIFAVISVWLCVAMVVIVISVMGGFLDTLKERSRGLLSDIVIDNRTLVGFGFYQEFIEHLKRAIPDQIAAATPVIYNYGIIRVAGESYTKMVRVVGIRLKEYEQVNDFSNSLYYDKYYPGTTTLGPQLQPFAGFSREGMVALPPDHEAAFKRFARDHPEAHGFESVGSIKPGKFAFSETGLPGYFDEEGDQAPGVIVGCSILNERNEVGEYVRIYPRGTKLLLTVLPLKRSGGLSAERAITAVVRMADDSLTRVYEIDNLCVYVDFDLLQEWLAMTPAELEEGGFAPARTSQVLVSLPDGADLEEGRARIEAEWKRFLSNLDVPILSTDASLLGYVTVETWEERQVQFIRAVEKEKILVTLLFSVISLVAVVLIGCIFWMIVNQKTRDIGIIKSVGASPIGIAMVFVGFGAAVGVLGAVLGGSSGAVFVWYINDIQDALVRLHPQLRVWSPDVYTFERIPNVVKWHEVAWIAAVAVVASVLGALIPAVIAGRVWPAEALRYE
ncbi:MAG: FtsX-like permease family protein [Phycisphaerae bacterium]